jgi:hypothetical protein
MSDTPYPPYRSLADVAALERVPFAERIATWDFHAMLMAGCARAPDKPAILFVADAAPLPVTIGDDPAHGTLARIAPSSTGEGERAAIDARIAAAMQHYALAWRIDWPGDRA